MALTPEDKKDVKTHLGKALANKVSKVTRDGSAKSKAIEGRSPEFREFNRTSPELKAARKGYNDARRGWKQKPKRGAFYI